MRAAVDRIAEECRLPDEDRFDLKVAATEAVTNALRGGSREVDVTIACQGRSVDIEVQGPSVFTPDLREKTKEPKPPEAEGGRGIPMMLALVDEVEYVRTRAGTRVRMRKRFSPAGEGDSLF